MRELNNGDLLFEYDNGEWEIRAEWPTDTPHNIDSYIYHTKCTSHNNSHGWCSAWDVREGVCYYCNKPIPTDIQTVWLLMEGSKMGGYMANKQQRGLQPLEEDAQRSNSL
jgi:hypothetical protein